MSQRVTVGALAYTAIAEAIENNLSATRMLGRFKATTRQSIRIVEREDYCISLQSLVSF